MKALIASAVLSCLAPETPPGEPPVAGFYWYYDDPAGAPQWFNFNVGRDNCRLDVSADWLKGKCVRVAAVDESFDEGELTPRLCVRLCVEGVSCGEETNGGETGDES